jgi:hypothetical protein
LPSHHYSKEDVSSNDWMSFDYIPPWSSEKEDSEEKEEEDKDAADATDDSDGSDSDFDSPPTKRASIFRLSSL